MVCFVLSKTISAQPHRGGDPAVNNRVEAVENNLVSWVKLNGNRNFNIYQRMKDLDVNGAVVAVIKNYRIHWIKAYGWADTARKKRMNVHTAFQAASVGKSVNAVGFMKLVQNKVLSLDTDINQYLKTWKFPYDSVSKGKKITVANLLSHTAGLTVHGFDGYEWYAPLPTIIQTLDGKYPANNPPVRSETEPGVRSQYSGGGITISELLLEDVMKNDYEKYMRKAVFNPLGMNRTTFATDPLDSNYATGYRFDKQKMQGRYMKFTERACGGAFWTTAGDLARLVIAVQLSVEGKNGSFLNKSTATTMLTPYLKNSNAALGYFIDKKGEELYFQHSGLNPGYSSQYYGTMHNGNGVVVMANGDMTDFAAEVVNAVATVYNWKDFYPYVPKKLIQPPIDSLKRYAGKYVFENSESGPEIIYDNGRMFLKDPNSPVKWTMYFTSPHDFFMLEAKWANQQFYLDENNDVAGFYIIGDGYKGKVIKKNK